MENLFSQEKRFSFFYGKVTGKYNSPDGKSAEAKAVLHPPCIQSAPKQMAHRPGKPGESEK